MSTVPQPTLAISTDPAGTPAQQAAAAAGFNAANANLQSLYSAYIQSGNTNPINPYPNVGGYNTSTPLQNLANAASGAYGSVAQNNAAVDTLYVPPPGATAPTSSTGVSTGLLVVGAIILAIFLL